MARLFVHNFINFATKSRKDQIVAQIKKNWNAKSLTNEQLIVFVLFPSMTFFDGEAER
jgi:hypothetical protein